MKILFEVPLKTSDWSKSSFTWLNVAENWLFTIEDGRKFKTIGTVEKPGSELSSSTLTEDKMCTSLSWNFDSTILALVFDRRQVWLWKIKSNDSIHYKPNQSKFTETEKVISKRMKSRDIDHVEWSKKSNKLVIGYSTGQLLLCDFDTPSPREILIDNSTGVLNPITFIQSSTHLDLFITLTTASELLIMSYEGSFRFYLPSGNSSVVRAKLSPPYPKLSYETFAESPLKNNQTVWLAHQRGTGALLLRNIKLLENHSFESTSESNDIIHEQNGSSDLVDFHWLSPIHLLACYSNGVVSILELERQSNLEDGCKFILKTRKLLNLSPQMEACEKDQVHDAKETFKAFQLRQNGSRLHQQSFKLDRSRSSIQKFSFAAMTSYEIFYYEIFADDSETGYSFERIDDLDITGSLQKLNLQLERVEWSHDCSMLAVQLTNSHVLVYRTRLQDYQVASYQSKIAYLSEAKEVTILNYDCNTSRLEGVEGDSKSEAVENQASVLKLSLKPSVIAIGSRHLAVALNNRVHFYLLKQDANESGLHGDALLIDEQEYVSVVTGLLLNSRFVAVQFCDGRLKLHAIQSELLAKDYTKPEYINEQDSGQFDERFFPDPVKEETISSVTLTEELLLYGTRECQLVVFSLKDWSVVQNCDHERIFAQPILKLKPNERGNKFICLLGEYSPTSGSRDHTVYLYDLYYNSMVIFFNNSLYERMFDSQLALLLPTLSRLERPCLEVRPKLNRIIDAIWDTDGRGLLLIETRRIYICITLDHTLEREQTSIEFVAAIDKASSYTTLYASHGIVSFQTNLGRVINLVSEPHDDELQLTRLKQQIEEVKKNATDCDLLSLQAKVMTLKLGYLRLATMIYSLQKCQDICEYLMNDEQFSSLASDQISSRSVQIDLVIWRQLVTWSLYTQNLNFALMLYKKHGLIVEEHVLSEIIEDARYRYLDSKSSVKGRLMLLLGCEDVNEEAD